MPCFVRFIPAIMSRSERSALPLHVFCIEVCNISLEAIHHAGCCIQLSSSAFLEFSAISLCHMMVAPVPPFAFLRSSDTMIVPPLPARTLPSHAPFNGTMFSSRFFSRLLTPTKSTLCLWSLDARSLLFRDASLRFHSSIS